MLLRSSSLPILKSWLPHFKDSSQEPEPLLHLPRTKSFSLTCFLLFNSSSSPVDDSTKRSYYPISKSDCPPKPKKKRFISKIKALQPEKEEEKDQKGKLKMDSGSSSSSSSSSTMERLFSSSGLGEKVMSEEKYCCVENEEKVLQTLVVGGGDGSNGGRICGGGGDGRGSGGGDGGDSGGGSGFCGGNNNHGSNSTDAYYQKMIEANPGNGLLLGNYAKFLKEVNIIKHYKNDQLPNLDFLFIFSGQDLNWSSFD